MNGNNYWNKIVKCITISYVCIIISPSSNFVFVLPHFAWQLKEVSFCHDQNVRTRSNESLSIFYIISFSSASDWI